MRFSLPLIALAAVAAPLNAAPALTTEEVVDVRINLSDLDITTANGRSAIEARIDAEVRKACTVPSASPYRVETIDESCAADARAEALAQVERMAAAAVRSSGTLAAN